MKYVLLLTIFLINCLRINAQDLSLVLPEGHHKDVFTTSFSPDGKWLATASLDNTIKLWDPFTGMLLQTFRENGPVIFAKFSPGDKYLFSSHGFLYDVLKRAPVWQYEDSSKGMSLAVFNKKGNLLLVYPDDSTARLVDVATGKITITFSGHKADLTSVAFSDDEKYIITSSYDQSVRLWDAATGRLVKTFYTVKDPLNNVYNATVTPGNKYIIASAYNGVYIWSLDGLLVKKLPGRCSGELVLFKNLSTLVVPVFNERGDGYYIDCYHIPDGIKRFRFPYGKPKNIQLFNNDQFIISDRYGNAEIRDAGTGKVIDTLNNVSPGQEAQDDFNTTLAINDKSKLIALSFQDPPSIMVWHSENHRMVANLKAHIQPVNTVAFVDSGLLAVTDIEPGEAAVEYGHDNFPKLWNLGNGSLIKNLTENGNTSASVQVNPAGGTLTTIEKYSNTAKGWHTNGMPAFTLPRTEYQQNIFTYSKNGNMFLHARDSTIFVYLADSAKMAFSIPLDGRVWDASFSNDNTFIVAAAGNKAFLVDIASQKIIETFNPSAGILNIAGIDPLNRYVVTGGSDSTIRIWDIASGKQTAMLPHQEYPDVQEIRFSADGKYFLSVSNDPYRGEFSHVWDLGSGAESASFFLIPAYNKSVQFTPSGNELLVKKWRDSTGIWNIAKHSFRLVIDGTVGSLRPEVFNKTGTKLLTECGNNKIKVWDLLTGALLATLNGHSGLVQSAFFREDEQRIITASKDNTIKYWDAATGKLIATFMSIDSAGYIIQIPSGYYMCTPATARLLHYVNKNLQFITVDQLDIKFNRPDIVLKALGNNDSALIESYRNAYIKRIQKLGIDTTMFTDGYSFPSADIINRDSLQYEQKQGSLMLHVRAQDTAILLDRFNAWVNGVPVFGVKGVNLYGRQLHIFDTTISISLSAGENRIEASVLNTNGSESYRSPLVVHYNPVNPEAISEKVFFIGLGINHFADSSQNLQWSVKDIRDIANRFRQKYGAALEVDTLFDSHLTVAAVKALKLKLLQSKVDDKVIIAYSGHGLFDKAYNYYLSTYAMDFKQPETEGLSYDVLESLLDSIPARRKLLLLDACHSGEIDRNDALAAIQAKVPVNSMDALKKAKMLKAYNNNRGGEGVGLQNSYELMQHLFVNIGRNTGATVISAAGGRQYAEEHGDLRNGTFSYSILEYLATHDSATVQEIHQYLNKRVPQLTNGRQVPTTRTENNQLDWELW
ncbi:MAG TPA: caspase family protein [Chitinophagaceae bacterium]|nr:caspase family protein [Chitinophagaceae bacterium]